MNVYKEFKEIALLNKEIDAICVKLEQEFGIDGLDLKSAKIIKGCKERQGHLYDNNGRKLDNCGLVDDDYYCFQIQGYIEDDYYGRLYYATDEKGVFIEVSFATY